MAHFQQNCNFYNKIKSFGQKDKKKLKEIFSYQKEETKNVKEVVDILHSHSFKCIENLKPNDFKFINQKNKDKKVYEDEINKLLKEKEEKKF